MLGKEKTEFMEKLMTKAPIPHPRIISPVQQGLESLSIKPKEPVIKHGTSGKKVPVTCNYVVLKTGGGKGILCEM